MRRYCTIPVIFNLRKWFEKSFGLACQYHDLLYTRKSTTRYVADKALVEHMVAKVHNKGLLSKVFIYYPTIGLTFLLVRLFGWARY